MLRFFRKVLKPDAYHGLEKQPPFFEGWYFKQIHSESKRTIAIIPGVFLGKSDENTEAFIQIFDSKTSKVSYISFPLNFFSHTENEFNITIGENTFSNSQLFVNIENEEIVLKGSLNFAGIVPWPVTIASPGIMGWYAWAPFMQCYHGVVSMNHTVSGSLNLNGELLQFENENGYIEKDWGRSFPASWIWMQANHFSTKNTSLMASVAIIPWIRGEFPGFIVGFLHEQKLHRFTTYLNSKLQKIVVNDEIVELVLENKTHVLNILAKRSKQVGRLIAPSEVGMNRTVLESLNANVTVQLIEKNTKKIVFNEQSNFAGLEAMGDLDALMKLWQKKS